MTKRKTAPPSEDNRRILTRENADKIVEEFLDLRVCDLSGGDSQDTIGQRLWDIKDSPDQGSKGLLRFGDAQELLSDVLTQDRGGSWVRKTLDALKARRDLLCELERFLDISRSRICVNRAAEPSLPLVKRPASLPPLDDPAPDVQAIAKLLTALDFPGAFLAIEGHARRVDPFDRQGRLDGLAAPRRDWGTPEQKKEQALLLERMRVERKSRDHAHRVSPLAEKARKAIEKLAGTVEKSDRALNEVLGKVTEAGRNARPSLGVTTACNSAVAVVQAAKRAVDAANAVFCAQTWKEVPNLVRKAEEENRALSVALAAKTTGSTARPSEDVKAACNDARGVVEQVRRDLDAAIRELGAAIRKFDAAVKGGPQTGEEAAVSPAGTHPRAGDRNPAAAFMLAAEAVVSEALALPPKASRRDIRRGIEDFVLAHWEQFTRGHLRKETSVLRKELVAFAKSQNTRLAKPGIMELHSLLSESRETFPVLKEWTGGDGVWVATPEFQQFLDEEPEDESPKK